MEVSQLPTPLPQLEGQTNYKTIITPTYITPAGPQQKCSPPMTQDLANEDKQACIQYKQFLSNVKKYKFIRALKNEYFFIIV